MHADSPLAQPLDKLKHSSSFSHFDIVDLSFIHHHINIVFFSKLSFCHQHLNHSLFISHESRSHFSFSSSFLCHRQSTILLTSDKILNVIFSSSTTCNDFVPDPPSSTSPTTTAFASSQKPNHQGFFLPVSSGSGC
jgi:hypothetical protein